jgi:galactokinase
VEERARTRFRDAFGVAAALVVRAPGRLNLIGEHTDYSLLPVLPIAIDRALWIAAGPRAGSSIRARSTGHEPPAELSLEAPPEDPRGWQRYLVAALGLLPEAPPGRGAFLLIDGDLPATGGLSSSSALVLGVLAALDAVFELRLGREELVARAIRAERRVGVETGGMDQTVIGFAEPGSALRIDFDPPTRRKVALPGALRLVAAYSGSAGRKADEARELYNTAVVACRIAAERLAREVGVTLDSPVLGRVRRMAGDPHGLYALAKGLPLRETSSSAARALGLDVERFVRLSAARVPPERELPVRACARHVLSEAERLEHAVLALEAGDLFGFGRLLDASQESLIEFGASSPALDAVVLALREAGALGARLTGAGFGGYAFGAFAGEGASKLAARRIARAFEVCAARGLELSR